MEKQKFRLGALKKSCCNSDVTPKSTRNRGKLSLSPRYGETSYQDEMKEALAPPDKYHWIRPPSHVYTLNIVAVYPENRHPGIPVKVLRHLSQLNAKDFLQYILHELSLEEREVLLVDEWQRRRTFMSGWPRNDLPNLTGIKMAQAGFYYLGRLDHVQCVFCRGALHDWHSDDRVMYEHGKSFPFCRFFKGLECGNIEYKSKKLTADDVANISFLPNREAVRDSTNEYDCQPLGVNIEGAGNRRYAPYATRVRTFARWPSSSPVAADALCEAGFYFSGFDDKVTCFYCLGGLREWSANSDPWEEHARWFPDCPYLLNKKGEEYVEQVHRTTPDNRKCKQETIAQSTAIKMQQEAQTTEDAMAAICRRLGHEADTIQLAIKYNEKPFEDIAQMIDMIHDIEMGNITCSTPRPANQESQAQAVAAHPEEQISEAARQRLEPPASAQQPILPHRTPSRFSQSCRHCEVKANKRVSATHIGLPCGHLILCGPCAEEVKGRAEASNSPGCCPYYDCGSELAGLMRVFFA